MLLMRDFEEFQNGSPSEDIALLRFDHYIQRRKSNVLISILYNNHRETTETARHYDESINKQSTASSIILCCQRKSSSDEAKQIREHKYSTTKIELGPRGFPKWRWLL